MAHHPPPVASFHPLPGSPAVRPNPFPNVVFSECLNQPPLDLNFSQKHAQNAVKDQTESKIEPTSLQKESEASPSSQQEIELKAAPDCATSNGALDSKAVFDSAPSKTLKGAAASQKSRCHWTHGEVIALFDAKKDQEERFEKGGKKIKSASEKWDEIAEFCSTQGFKKLASQCKDKWERLWPAFRKILDWERQPPSGKGSYWTMSGDEREREGFPRGFDKELYDAMSCRFGFVRSLNLSSIVVDSSNEDADVPPEAATNACNEPVQSVPMIFEDGPSVVDDHAPISFGRKRKSTARANCVKELLPPAESSKRIVLCLEANEENGAARSSKDLHLKNKPADFTDRRLVLEERRLRLAERKLIFEEKKLEATIEIGKGLIASMDRMTNVISNLGISSPSTT